VFVYTEGLGVQYDVRGRSGRIRDARDDDATTTTRRRDARDESATTTTRRTNERRRDDVHARADEHRED